MDIFKGRILILFLLLNGLIVRPSFSQVTDSSESSAVSKGVFKAHLRSFFMATDNDVRLKDAYALAFGAGLSYETPKFHGFQGGFTGFFIFNLVSSDLGLADPLSKGMNRYEIGLFDINRPDNKMDLDRLEDLFIRYNYGKSKIELGRFEINTPFINRQDGRMRGTIEEGVWAEVNQLANIKLEGGWLWKISPRSTIDWYRMEDSYGVYAGGVNEEGKKSDYAGNVQSIGTALAGLTVRTSENVKFQVWNQFAENVFNTAMLQSDISLKLKGSKKVLAGAMIIRQDALANGGHPDPARAYIKKGSQSYVFSTRLGLSDGKSEWTLNYTQFSKDDRFLMPREWGREPFYTFMPRERTEGAAGVKAMVAKWSGKSKNGKWKPSLAAGYFDMPDVKDFKHNKYGMPSFAQVNAEVRYAFAGKLKGLQAFWLVAYKKRVGETYGEYKYVFNKVNMFNWNLVIDYTF